MTNHKSVQGDAIVAELHEGNGEAVATLAFLAEALEADPQAAFAKTVADWRQWLVDEGYMPESVVPVIAQVLASELDAAEQQALLNNAAAGLTLAELAKGIHAQSPTLLDALLRHVDHGAALQAAVLGAAGGRALFNKPVNYTAESNASHKLKSVYSVYQEVKEMISNVNSNGSVGEHPAVYKYDLFKDKENSGGNPFFRHQEEEKITTESTQLLDAVKSGSISQQQVDDKISTERQAAWYADEKIGIPEKQLVADEISTERNEIWEKNQREERNKRIREEVNEEISMVSGEINEKLDDFREGPTNNEYNATNDKM